MALGSTVRASLDTGDEPVSGGGVQHLPSNRCPTRGDAVTDDLCIWCNVVAADPGWEPYCSGICAVSAESDRFNHVTLRDQLAPAYKQLERARSGRKCFPKAQHDTEALAAKHAQALVNRNRAGNIHTLVAYECPHCPKWHIGHTR